MLSDHISSVCSVVIMTSFTIRWQTEQLIWKRVVRYGFRFSKTFKTTEYPEHTKYGTHRFQGYITNPGLKAE